MLLEQKVDKGGFKSGYDKKNKINKKFDRRIVRRKILIFMFIFGDISS